MKKQTLDDLLLEKGRIEKRVNELSTWLLEHKSDVPGWEQVSDDRRKLFNELDIVNDQIENIREKLEV